MVRACIFCMLFCSFIISGCITTRPPATSAAQESDAQECRTKLASVEMELNRLKDENYSLRKQLEAAGQQAIRMPNATEIQTALKKAGIFKGVVDGKIGPETKEAIRKFQQANGMTPDGVVGSKTWSLLSKYLGN